MNIVYVTSNKAKFEEANLILDPVRVRHAPLHLEEIQGTRQEIARHKMKEAFQHFNEPCIIDDVSLYCPCIGGLPGPYIRTFLEMLGEKNLAELIGHYQDRSCTVICTIAFAPSRDTEPLFFEGVIEGTLVHPRGTRKTGTSWNAIVEPNGFTKTYAEMSLDEMSKHSPRSRALGLLKKYLLEQS